MYDFKHQIHDNQRFNTYEIYVEDNKSKISFYQKVRNGLFLIILVISIFITGACSFKTYQKHSYKNNVVISQEIPVKKNNSAHLALTQAITKSVVYNLQSQEKLETINYHELKLIIKEVVHKIQDKPITTKYTKK